MLSPWQPGPEDPFDLKRAGHLCGRAGFGASLAERQRMVEQGVDQAVAAFFASEQDRESLVEMLELIVAQDEIQKLRAFWFWRMLEGRDRLAERMTYFWHGHFATSNAKVGNPRLMAGQWWSLREHALGSFDDLLGVMTRDPAMIKWLDNDSNVKGQPNENYARELFELFALGRGTYSERDIREAARAFTGWQLRDGRYHFNRTAHDTGKKTVFGQSGAWGGEDILRMTVQREDSARFIARKLLAFFVHPEPTEAEVDALAACYIEAERHIGATLKVLLRSELFFSDRAYRSRIKSPTDYILVLLRSLGGTAAANDLSRAAMAMGEALLEPPSVEGWQGERDWLSSATWLLRSNFAFEIFLGGHKFAPDLSEALGNPEGEDEILRAAVEHLLNGDLDEPGRRSLQDVAARGIRPLCHAVMIMPEAQLL